MRALRGSFLVALTGFGLALLLSLRHVASIEEGGGLHRRLRATQERAPLRVWLFVLVILTLLAALGAALFVGLNDRFTFFAHGHLETVGGRVITGSLTSPG
jgi:hypothetical protein